MSNATLEYLSKSMNSNVLVSVKANYWLRGILRSFDQHLNLVMDNVEAIFTSEEGSENQILKIGKRVLIRGDNIVAISSPNLLK